MSGYCQNSHFTQLKFPLFISTQLKVKSPPMQHGIQKRQIFSSTSHNLQHLNGYWYLSFQVQNLSLRRMLLNSFHNFNLLLFPKHIVALPFPFPTKFSKSEQICLEGCIIIFNCHSSIHLFYIFDRHFPLYFDSFSSTEIFIMFPASSSVFFRSFCKFRTHPEDKGFQVILTILH